MGDSKRKVPPSAAAAGAAQKRQSVPVSVETMRLRGAMLQRVAGLRNQSGEKSRRAKAEWGSIQQVLEGEVGQDVEMADAADVASRHYKAVSERYGEAGRAAAKAESELEQLKKRETALMEEADQHRQEHAKKRAKVDKWMSIAQRGVADPKPFDVYLKEREADLVALEGKLMAVHQEGPLFEILLDEIDLKRKMLDFVRKVRLLASKNR
jgi:hypothetical protein